MKKLFILISILVLFMSCSEIDYTYIKKAELFCKDKGGIKLIRNETVVPDYCECNNGSSSNFNILELIYNQETDTYSLKENK